METTESVSESFLSHFALPGDYDVSTSRVCERISKPTFKHNNIYLNAKVEEIPNYSELKKKVDAELSLMTWWEAYGIDNVILILGAAGAVSSFFIMKSDSTVICIFGIILLGCCHSLLSVKGGHLAAHRAAVQSVPLNRLLAFFFSDVCGSFPSDTSYTIHVKEHHPYTNIIGIGDSSTWKAPFVPAYFYMFVTPLCLPVITPFVAVATLWGQWLKLLRFGALASLGLCANFSLFMHVSQFTFLQSLLLTLVSRGMLSIPYIHVNIFQHIGLPMYRLKDKPTKLYQMSTGVLNLSRNALLDHCFGHSIISAHVEHHLFPRLSDQQCLRVKPLVRRFLKDHGLAYNEADYTERLRVFLTKYRHLMVLTPPVSHFVGIQ